MIKKKLDSRIKFKENNNLFNSCDKDIFNNIIKFPEKNKMYDKYGINLF